MLSDLNNFNYKADFILKSKIHSALYPAISAVYYHSAKLKINRDDNI